MAVNVGSFPVGADFDITFVLHADGSRVDLTGATVTANVADVFTSNALTAVQAGEGEYMLTVVPSDTSARAPGTYMGSVKAVLATGEVRFWEFEMSLWEPV